MSNSFDNLTYLYIYLKLSKSFAHTINYLSSLEHLIIEADIEINYLP